MVPYPRERFIGKQQGNFLHFVHLVYEKHLPLYFSVDQILYSYIETTNYTPCVNEFTVIMYGTCPRKTWQLPTNRHKLKSECHLK